MINPAIYQQVTAKLGRILGFETYFEDPQAQMIRECAEGRLFRESASYLPEGWGVEVRIIAGGGEGVLEGSPATGRVQIGDKDEWIYTVDFAAVESGSGEFMPEVTVQAATLTGQAEIRRFGYVQELAIELADLLTAEANNGPDEQAAEWLAAKVSEMGLTA